MMVPALLRGRVFRRYWGASTISMFGDQISGVALPLAAVLALHAGAAQLGYWCWPCCSWPSSYPGSG